MAHRFEPGLVLNSMRLAGWLSRAAPGPGIQHRQDPAAKRLVIRIASARVAEQDDPGIAGTVHAKIRGKAYSQAAMPAHLHYGAHIGLYDSAADGDPYRIYWNAHLDGRLSMHEALVRISQDI
jgi:hypothetical protein